LLSQIYYLVISGFWCEEIDKYIKKHIGMLCFVSVLSGTNLENSKQVLLKIIDKILVNKDKIEVLGLNFKIAEFVSKTKMGTSDEVPTFVSIWR